MSKLRPTTSKTDQICDQCGEVIPAGERHWGEPRSAEISPYMTGRREHVSCPDFNPTAQAGDFTGWKAAY